MPKLYQDLARTLAWEPMDEEHQKLRDKRLANYIAQLPRGSGIDTDLTVTYKPNKILISFSYHYHHMNDGGFYDGWTDHTVIVTPSLAYGFDIRITGRNRNDIKEYLSDVFHYSLDRETRT